LLAACGGQQRQDVGEPSHTYPVQVTAATFPADQRLSQHTHLVITVRNSGNKTIPDIAVTITDPHQGTAVKAFGTNIQGSGLASRSRPVWVIDHPPGPCTGSRAYSCQAGGAGGYASAYANTWAAGRLPPGQSAKFDWGVTAVTPGSYQVHYVIAAGLNGKAKARLSGGGIPQGLFTVKISGKASQTYVNNSGQILPGR
jgi:hypothetical protein